MRILLVSQMYPGADDPDLGVFVASLEHELLARGHELERAVVDRRVGGRRRHLKLFRDARRAAQSFDPEVVYAHFLVPAGLAAALASKAPLVVTAHGQDVANAIENAAVRAATRYVVRRATHVIAVSAWLRDRLQAAVTEAASKTAVVDCGVDLERFAPRSRDEARAEVGWPAGEGTAFLCLGGLSERKNVLRLARAFEGRGEGTLTFVGGGPLRSALEGRPGIRLVGRVSHDEVPLWIAAADVVCQPRRGSSSTPKTRTGSPSRSMPLQGFRARTSPLARRPSHTTSGCRRPGWRRSSSKPFEVREPDLDERPDRVLEPGFARDCERLLVGLAHLLRRDALL
jgi:glycosyltransferase involved in cell wall biosynthesis